MEVGKRVRFWRLEMRITQSELADSCGVSFQKIQKYEKGINRVSAGKLKLISEKLKVPVSYFYGRGDARDAVVMEFGETAQMVRAMRAYRNIKDSGKRRLILPLLEQLAQDDQDGLPDVGCSRPRTRRSEN